MKQCYEEMYENSAEWYDRDLQQWYEKFLVNSKGHIDEEAHISGTAGEVDFIERELELDTSAAILDIGCGTGRHAIELAKRGHSVTAIDLSESQLERARMKAAAANVHVQFVKADARALDCTDEFDAVVLLDAAFGEMETDEMDFEILKNASRACKRRGVFILVTTNGLYPLYHSVKDFINAHYKREVVTTSTFDLLTFRERSEYEHVDDDDNKRLLKCNERYYVPPEMTWLLKTVGFSEIGIYGAELGNWSRDKQLSTDDFDMLVVARKEA